MYVERPDTHFGVVLSTNSPTMFPDIWGSEGECVAPGLKAEIIVNTAPLAYVSEYQRVSLEVADVYCVSLGRQEQ